MAFVRPIVYVYQQFQSVVLAPGVSDLNCCIVGPAFHIQDYPTDKDDITVGNFVKSGQTKDAPCDDDGLSTGRPDPSADFLVLSDPPNHVSGGVLDSASVKLMFDECLIDLAHSNNGALATNSPILTCAGFNFGDLKVAVGDRVVLTNDALTETVVDTVREVAPGGDNTKLKLTSSKLSATVGTADINWRVEHELSDVEIGNSYVAVNGNEITIKTLAAGIQTLYESASWTVNYASMYVGYREHRTDLQDVQVINSVDTIESTLGRVDERNPLATGVQVAMANTGTPVQAFGVVTDDLAGHQSARDRMTARSDIYALVPVTDALSKSDWVNVIAMWKNHCVAFAAYDVGKFRVVIGSYDDLPEEKSSVAPSDEGNTEVSEPATAPYDVFVDPASATNFLTAEVGAAHLLDVTHCTQDDQNTVKAALTTKSIFDKDYAAKQLRGAIGGKRLRVAAGHEFGTTSEYLNQTGMYMVRSAWLKAEGGTGYTEDVDQILWNDNTVAQIEKTGAFTGVSDGDVAFVTGAATTGNNGGWRVTKVDADKLDLPDLTYAADANSGQVGFGCHVYHAIGYYDGGTTVAADHKFSGTGAFASAAAGDVIFCWDASASTIKGMWVITNIIDDDNAVVGDPGGIITAAGNATAVDFSVFRLPTVEVNANATLSTRQRLDQLRDDSASFVGNVDPGEDIEIPYPASTDPLYWDTQTTKWAVDSVVSNEILIADLGDLEELAPKQFVQGYDSDDMSYRIAIDLAPDSQVTELNTITNSLSNSRCVMVWPNEVYVTDLENALTSAQNKQTGQYLACAVGGMVAGLPSHQGFTYIGIAGIQQIFNSNFYFTDSQLTDLRDGGWYVFVQDSETSLPYTIHEVTTDVSAYEFGEFMNVKNFDYIALYMKEVLEQFLGKYNITTETLEMIRASLNAAAAYLQLRIFPKIGVPLLGAEITSLTQSETEKDRVEVYMDIELPAVLNRIGLHLVA
jgi:hypothetical protein